VARKHLKAGWNFATPGKLSWLIGEIFRVPDTALTGPFTRGQFLSLFMFIIGFAFLWRT
jgi:prolipoprotein diacylglyceryltransferase